MNIRISLMPHIKLLKYLLHNTYSRMTYILVFVLCLGCKNEKYIYTFPIFPITYKATTTILNTDVMFSYYMQPLLIDSLLIIPDVNRDTILQFYNIRLGELMKQAVIKGKGPGELILPTKFSMDYFQKQLYAFDYTKKSIIRYDIRQIVNDVNPFFQEIPLSEPLLQENEISYLKDSVFLTSNGKHRLLIATTQKRIATNDDHFPPITTSPQRWNSFLQTWACHTTNPSGDKYVCATSLGGIIEIYKLTPEIALTNRLLLFEPKFTQENNHFTPTPETMYGFRNVFASDKYIYATVFARQNPTRYPNLIWQFDWDGNPIASIECPYEIGNFTVDKNDKKIYAIIYNSEREEFIASLDIKAN